MIDRLYEHNTLEDVKDVLNKVSGEINSIRNDIEGLKEDVYALDIPMDLSDEVNSLDIRISKLE